VEIRQIKNQKEWNSLIASQYLSQFLQSWEWGVFQESLGRKLFRLALINEKKENILAQVVKMKLPLGFNYLYVPRGPIFNKTKNINGQEIINEICRLTSDDKTIFLKIEPTFADLPPALAGLEDRTSADLSAVTRRAEAGVHWLKDEDELSLFLLGDKIEISGQLVKTSLVQPEQTIILDLSKREDDLLKEMHYKTRYNIRLAQKHGVRIKTSSVSDQDISIFLNLLKITSVRDSFRAHPADYYRQMFKILGNDNQNTSPDNFFIRLYQAERQGEILAANLVGFFGDTVTYLHGASSDESRQVMAPYLLQWQIILDAKKQGYRYYDFWGIDEKLWPGVTRFKIGFGGKRIKFFGVYDYIINSAVYWLYRFAKKII